MAASNGQNGIPAREAVSETAQKLKAAVRVERSTAEVVTITGGEALDPITVYLQDFGFGRGRITIECYGKVWTTYFGAYGNGTLAQFVGRADRYYLLNRFLPTNLGVKAMKSESAYLTRILAEVRAVFEKAIEANL